MSASPDEAVEPGDAGGAAEWVFKWIRALRATLDGATDGVRLKDLRKAVLSQYLAHLSKQRGAEADRAWWDAHPEELRSLFAKHLAKAKRKGRLARRGKMVHRRP